jgi:hypothetical protein
MSGFTELSQGNPMTKDKVSNLILAAIGIICPSFFVSVPLESIFGKKEGGG